MCLARHGILFPAHLCLVHHREWHPWVAWCPSPHSTLGESAAAPQIPGNAHTQRMNQVLHIIWREHNNIKLQYNRTNSTIQLIAHVLKKKAIRNQTYDCYFVCLFLIALCHSHFFSSLSDLNFLDLVIQATDVSIGFLWCLLQLHDSYHGVSVIPQHSHHCMDLKIPDLGGQMHLQK